MADYFYCNHCGKRTLKNPRLKEGQKYCGRKSCQQARKNRWERAKMKKDASYRKRRLDQKARWRKDYKADQYQKVYRQNHPDYVKDNREQQQLRNKNAQKSLSEFLNANIVKTDPIAQENASIYIRRVKMTTEVTHKRVKLDQLDTSLQDLRITRSCEMEKMCRSLRNCQQLIYSNYK